MKLAEMCRKLETEEEKVIPFYSCSLTAEEEEAVASAEAEEPSESLAKVWSSDSGSSDKGTLQIKDVLLNKGHFPRPQMFTVLLIHSLISKQEELSYKTKWLVPNCLYSEVPLTTVYPTATG